MFGIGGATCAGNEGEDTDPFHERGEVSCSRPEVIACGAVGEEQFRASFAGFFLFSGEPVAERGDEIIVGEVVEAFASFVVAFGGEVSRFESFGVSRSDQSKLGVENADEGFEIAGVFLVAGRRQEFGVGAHGSLDFAASLGEECPQDISGSLLVKPVHGAGGGSVEGFFEEGDADARDSSEFGQGGRSPAFVLDHFRKQGEVNGDDAVRTGEFLNGSGDKEFLFLRDLGVLLGESAVGLSDGRQDFFGVIDIEEVDGCDIFAANERDFEFVHEVSDGHPEIVTDTQDRLEVLAVGLAQCQEKIVPVLGIMGMKVLLKLIEDDEQLASAGEDLATADGNQNFDE